MQWGAELLVKGAFEGMMISRWRALHNHQVHVEHTFIGKKKKITEPRYRRITVKVAIYASSIQKIVDKVSLVKVDGKLEKNFPW